MMKMSFYEQVGIVIPGSILVFGLVLYYPELQILTAKDGMSVGEFGLFVLIAYAGGHLIAAIANALEGLFWGILGGMPSDWVFSPEEGSQLRRRLLARTLAAAMPESAMVAALGLK